MERSEDFLSPNAPAGGSWSRWGRYRAQLSLKARRNTCFPLPRAYTLRCRPVMWWQVVS